jgi:hypothetical protein
VIGRETVRPNLDPGLARLLSQKISIDCLVTVIKKDRLPTISTLRNDAEGRAFDEHLE